MMGNVHCDKTSKCLMRHQEFFEQCFWQKAGVLMRCWEVFSRASDDKTEIFPTVFKTGIFLPRYCYIYSHVCGNIDRNFRLKHDLYPTLCFLCLDITRPTYRNVKLEHVLGLEKSTNIFSADQFVHWVTTLILHKVSKPQAYQTKSFQTEDAVHLQKWTFFSFQWPWTSWVI